MPTSLKSSANLCRQEREVPHNVKTIIKFEQELGRLKKAKHLGVLMPLLPRIKARAYILYFLLHQKELRM